MYISSKGKREWVVVGWQCSIINNHLRYILLDQAFSQEFASSSVTVCVREYGKFGDKVDEKLLTGKKNYKTLSTWCDKQQQHHTDSM